MITPPTSNWAGNVAYAPANFHEPSTAEEIPAIVRTSQHVRVLGTRHTFNGLPATPGDMISTARLNRVLHIDAAAQTATVQAGITYGALGAALYQQGWAVDNLPSLPHVCVNGAIQTGTHGSGTQNLAASVTGMRLVTADGEFVHLSRETHPNEFDGSVVALGLLGVVTELTLRITKSFEIQQTVYERVPLDEVAMHYDTLIRSAYSVSVFTDWQSAAANQIWIKRRPTDAPLGEDLSSMLRGKLATTKRHPIEGMPADFCSEQGPPGPAFERLPHFRPDHPPSSAGAELQSEYFVDRKDAARVLKVVAALGPKLRDHLMVCEIRSIDADGLWLSPHYNRSSIAIHFTWFPKPDVVKQLMSDVIEPALAPLSPRAHWGKLHTYDAPAIRKAYPRFDDFSNLRTRYDPTNKFLNAFTQSLLWPATPSA